MKQLCMSSNSNNPFRLGINVVSSAAGGKCNGPPGVRTQYCATYYGAFVMDPEGRNNIEAVCLKPAFWAEPWGWLGWSAAGTLACAIGGGIGKWVGLI